MTTIPLTKGFKAPVDADDFIRLGRFRWCVSEAKGRAYAVRAVMLPASGVCRLLLHREVMRAPTGTFVGFRNGNGLDCRRANLLVLTRQEHQWMMKAKGGKSTYKGVSWHSLAKKWQVHIKHDGKKNYIGLFESEIDAAMAYDGAALATFGPIAFLNFPMALNAAP